MIAVKPIEFAHETLCVLPTARRATESPTAPADFGFDAKCPVAERARVAFRVLGRSRTSARLLGVSSSMMQLDELDPIMARNTGSLLAIPHRASATRRSTSDRLR